MRISDIMRKPQTSLPQNATLREIVQKFVSLKLDALPVIDAAQRVVGLITVDHLIDLFLPRYYEMLRDFAVLEDKGQLASVFDAAHVDLGRLDDKLILAADLMKNDLQWIHQEDSLFQAASRLRSQNMKHLPVVDRDQKLVGAIADFEVILALFRGPGLAPANAGTKSSHG